MSLIISLTLTHLAYCSAMLVGIPSILLNWLQSVLNAAVWYVHRRRQSYHITSLIRTLLTSIGVHCSMAGHAYLPDCWTDHSVDELA